MYFIFFLKISDGPLASSTPKSTKGGKGVKATGKDKGKKKAEKTSRTELSIHRIEDSDDDFVLPENKKSSASNMKSVFYGHLKKKGVAENMLDSEM